MHAKHSSFRPYFHAEIRAREHQPAMLCTLVKTENTDSKGVARYPVGIMPVMDPQTGETLGDPLDPVSRMGAMVDARHAATVMRFIDGGRKSARLVAGGDRVAVDGRGSFVQPTIFDEVSPDDPLARDEIFGPVLSVIAFDSEEEAVRIAKDSVYGLAASLWTDSLSRAHRIEERLRVGTVSVNTVDALSPMTPFGGFKQSGFGRDLSLHALDKYTALKTTWIKY